MEIKQAKSAGFCFGVKRAVDTVYEAAKEQDVPVYTYGPIIHNAEVVQDLSEKGVAIVAEKEDLLRCKGGLVIIRSHGVGREIYDFLKQHDISYLDATCPFVLKIHRLVEKYTAEGYRILIFGDKSHPEVAGICTWGEVRRTDVLESMEEAENFPISKGNEPEKLCVVAQTTFHNKKFQELVAIISEKGYDIIVINTICNATQERQSEAKEIASAVEAMIVIGDTKSSNTRKLYEISKKECKYTYYIQKAKDLDLTKLKSAKSVGITAGASTPNNIIEEVQNNVRNEF
ncbi:4-hydroxy-3-methylbut-2-enyl diphosphate reductase [Clostridia bacterium]|nr:4-hydroxy-3-methylbut-2-enyl diphosphate reductase [Clostridia bacterium]